jgi:ubiquitin-hydrolase Zn-finger-containing protein
MTITHNSTAVRSTNIVQRDREADCLHVDQVRRVRPHTPLACEECRHTGSWWVFLRLCPSCGHVGCCDQLPNKHATKYFHKSQDPLIQSFDPDEDWASCNLDELFANSRPCRKALR